MSTIQPAPNITGLRYALEFGDADARRAAISQACALGRDARPLLPLISNSVRAGLFVLSPQIVDLVIAFPDSGLYDAAVDAQTSFGPDDLCRLFKHGIGDYEQYLCNYVYQNWRVIDPWVSYILEALEVAGSRKAADMLTAILPDVSIWAATKELDYRKVTPIHPTIGDKLAEFEIAAIRQRRDRIRHALAAISRRLTDNEVSE